MGVVPQEYIEHHVGADAYTDLHAAVIDIVVSLRTIKQDLLLLYVRKAILTLYDDIIEDEDTKQSIQSELQQDEPLLDVKISDLSTVLNSINKQLEPLSFEIAESVDMDDSSILFSFVNKKATGAIQLSTKYSQNEIQLVKHAIDTIFSPENVSGNNTDDDDDHNDENNKIKYTVSYIQMLRQMRNGPTEDDENVASFNKLSMTEAVSFLQDLECYGWLERIDNSYTLATRGLVELKSYLIDTYGVYPDGTISKCHGCSDILTRGYACEDSKCGIRFHKQCQVLFQNSRSSTNCPGENCDKQLESFYAF